MANKSSHLVLVTEDPYNAETPLSALLDEVTPSDLVYVRDHFDVPQLDATKWSLDVNGAVEKPISLSYAEIQALDTKTLAVTLECAGNGRLQMDPLPKGTLWGYGAVSIVEFTGTPLVNVLKMAGISDRTVEVLFRGADRGDVKPGRKERFDRSLTIDMALHSDTLLAWEMNGAPLTPKHGYPMRLVVPGWYGMASVKWLTQVTLLTEPFYGFFQNEHYVYLDEEGTQEGEPVQHIRTRSLILSPVDGTVLIKGTAELIEGIAWSGHGPITQVDVSVDGGDLWLKAELAPPSIPHGVQRWRFKWSSQTPGGHTVLSRATDALDHLQPASQISNRLGYGNNGPQAVVVSVQ
jgi:DMSO/TMAO reductase YedYZ molybdopterin-dependent catalytic subunit